MTEESRKKILFIEIIEDDEKLRNVFHDKLKLEGYEVIMAKDGQEGLESALSEHPDLILLDVMMPKMNGMTVMEKIRQAGQWGKDVPIILLTNINADDDKINQAIVNNEPAYYLVKSNSTLKDLIEKIKERLSRKS